MLLTWAKSGPAREKVSGWPALYRVCRSGGACPGATHCPLKVADGEGADDQRNAIENGINANQPDQRQQTRPGEDKQQNPEDDREHPAEDQQPFIGGRSARGEHTSELQSHSLSR